MEHFKGFDPVEKKATLIEQKHSETSLNLVQLSDQSNSIVKGDFVKPSTSWVPGLIATEGTGAVLGAAGGGTAGYFGTKIVGSGVEFLMNSMAKGGRVVAPTAIEEFAEVGALKGGLYGAGIGLAAAGLVYGGYEGYKWLTEDKKQNNESMIKSYDKI